MSSSIQNISLFIPRVFSNIDEERISNKFEEMNIGKVSRVDLVSQYGKNYNSVYIHFEYWNDNEDARSLQSSIQDPEKEARVVYDEPWFWIVLENKGRKQPANTQRKPCVDLTDFAEPAIESEQVVTKSYKSVVLGETEFCEYEDKDPYIDEFQYTEKDFQNMDELEDIMDEEESFQKHFDSRYVKSIEEEMMIICDANGRLQYEMTGLKNQVQHIHQFYIEGIMKHLPIGQAIELRKKMGF
jgi:hypothetical protein